MPDFVSSFWQRVSWKTKAYFHRRNHPAHALVKGNQPVASGKTSCIFFSVHKSATSFMAGYLGDVAKEAGLTHIDYNGYFLSQGKKGLARQSDPELIRQVFHNRGYLYGPLRYYLDIPGADQYRIALFLRDPRDVLTSQYFSLKFSHPLLTGELAKKRKNAAALSIDEHVRMQAERFFITYSTYFEKLAGRKNVLILKYEDMIIDFPGFLEKLNIHFELDLTSGQKLKLDRSGEFLVDAENTSLHKRKVAAGDHREKLQPETIQWLNEKFGPILLRLGYRT
jgi:hypothetical protein